MSAVAPMRKSWKRRVIQARMPIDPRMISRKACWIRSLLTMPLIELRLTFPVDRPEARLEGRREGAQLAAGGRLVGSRRCRSTDSATGWGSATATGTDSDWGWGSDSASGWGSARATGEPEAPADPLAPGVEVGLGEAVGLAVAEADAELGCEGDGGGVGVGLGGLQGDDGQPHEDVLQAVLRARRDRRVAEALGVQDLLHLVRARCAVLEMDLPHRAAGVVDGELDADLARRDGREEDEDRAPGW